MRIYLACPVAVEPLGLARLPPRPASDADTPPADATDPAAPRGPAPHSGPTRMQRLTRHPNLLCDLRYRQSIADHRQHGLIPQLGYGRLPHQGSVKDQLKPLSSISRNTVSHQPKTKVRHHPTKHRPCAPGRDRTCDQPLRRRLLYPLSYGGIAQAILPKACKPMDTSSTTLKRMAEHHTKDKGDLGVAKVHADLVSQGFTVLFPATEHAPFDLVAYAGGTFNRLQVKYRSARTGAVTVKFRSMWADRNGTHTTPTDKEAIDTVCIYCPETDACYYVRPVEHGASVTLRISPSRNGQQAGVLDAAAFRQLHTR